MNTKQIDYALELAQVKNFNRAAENLFIFQPSLSYQIQALENEIGLALFLRSGRGAEVTPAGEQFFQTLRNIREELKAAIEEKTSVWGVSILFVEIRDIVIPKDLQRAMSAEARADREKDARIVLAEVERDIAAMLHDASDIYRDDDIALKLRQMHLVNESLKDSKGSIVVPSSYADGFVEGGADKDGR